HPAPPQAVLDFLAERLRVQLRAEGARHDVLAAVFAAGAGDDFTRLLARTHALTRLLQSAARLNLLPPYPRPANILRIEARTDGPQDAEPDRDLFSLAQEADLYHALHVAAEAVGPALAQEDFAAAMACLARLRPPLDAFFDKVTVNAPEPNVRL